MSIGFGLTRWFIDELSPPESSRSLHSVNRGSIEHQTHGIVLPAQSVQPDPQISVLSFTRPMKDVSVTQQRRHLTGQIGKTNWRRPKHHVRQAWMEGQFRHTPSVFGEAPFGREGSKLDQ